MWSTYNINISKEIPAFAGFLIKLTWMHTDLWYTLGTIIENLHKLKSVTLSGHQGDKRHENQSNKQLNTDLSEIV